MDERRAQLVELGLREFGTRTFDEISIDDLARRAGISKGLLYHYFPTKRAFYVACVREAAARLLARMDEAAPPQSEDATAGLEAYLLYVRDRGRAYTTLMQSGPGVDREVKDIVDQTRQALLDRLLEGLKRTLSPEALEAPLLRIALRGWVGLAETASIAWVEATVAQPARAPAMEQVRDLLASSLVGIVQQARG